MTRQQLKQQTGINRNIVECKEIHEGINPVTVYVLIETLWNVKTNIKELIPLCRMGINRNIVECKATYADYLSMRINVLIETLWNVKSILFPDYCRLLQY